MSMNRPRTLLLVGLVLLGATVASAATPTKTFTSGSGSLYFSSSLVNDRISRPLDQIEPVNENIMDTPITGKTHLTGSIKSSLASNKDAGLIQILLKAHSSSQTTGTHWPVILHDQSKGKLVGSVDILLNGLTFSTEHEKAAAVIRVTNQQVQSEIGSSSWVLSIAKGKIRDSQPAANREAENLAEKNIRSQLKEQVSKVLQDAKANLESSLIDPLTKSGMRPQSVQFQTTNAWLILTANWGKSTTTTPPTFEPSADLVATMPETTFVKVYNSLTGEQVKTVSDLESKLTEFTLPKSWNQSAPLTLIKKETRDGNLILQWSRAR